MKPSRSVSLFAQWLLVCALGCSGGGAELIPVSGTVKYSDGSVPQGESAVVWFEPIQGGKAASGVIQNDGSFELMTFKPGDGVKPGRYKVVAKVYKNYRTQALAVPAKYGDASTTPLEATVDASNTSFDFVIEK